MENNSPTLVAVEVDSLHLMEHHHLDSVVAVAIVAVAIVAVVHFLVEKAYEEDLHLVTVALVTVVLVPVSVAVEVAAAAGNDDFAFDGNKVMMIQM